MKKLGSRSETFGLFPASRYSYRYKAYEYNHLPGVLTKIPKKHLFKKRLKRYLINNADLPWISPAPDQTMLLGPGPSSNWPHFPIVH